MIRSIFLKEFYKIRWLWLLAALINISVCIYILIATRRLFILDHPEVVWYRVLHLGRSYYDGLKYVPLLTGVIIAFIQYLPEMSQQRLRLSLHLPVSPHLLILIHLWVGLTALVLAVLPDFIALLWITLVFFPAETVRTVLMTASPWFLAGIAAYLGGMLILLEPNLKQKTLNLVISAGTAGLYLHPALPGGYEKAGLFLVLPILLMVLSVLLPAYRFRYRRTT